MSIVLAPLLLNGLSGMSLFKLMDALVLNSQPLLDQTQTTQMDI
jgi:hypothetical protein